jgi:hypothetical protein
MCGYYAIEWSRPIVTRSLRCVATQDILSLICVSKYGWHSLARAQIADIGGPASAAFHGSSRNVLVRYWDSMAV